MKLTLTAVACCLIVAASSASAPAALADPMTVTGASIDATPGWQAGGHSDIEITTDFCSPEPGYPCNSTQLGSRLKTLVLDLPPGLVGNPLAVPRCSEVNRCGSESRIGTMTIWQSTAADAPSSKLPQLDIFNLTPQSGEVGRFGTILGTTVAEVRPDNGYAVRATTGNIPSVIKVARIEIQLFGMSSPYMTNPTSCKPAKLGVSANSHSDASYARVTSDAFVPTGCEYLGFRPRASIAAGGAGVNARGTSPPLSIHITHPAGTASASALNFTLPHSIKPTIAGLASRACPPDRLASGCPGIAPVGQSIVSVPALGAPLSGPIYLVRVPGQLALDMIAQLGGPFSAQFTGRATFSGAQPILGVAGLPDLPIDGIDVTLFGGTGGILANTDNLCNGSSQFGYTFLGHNGTVLSGGLAAAVPECVTTVKVANRTYRVKRKGRRATVRVSCGDRGADCTGRLTLATGSGKRKKRAATARFAVRAGRSKTISIRLTRFARKRLKHRRALRISAVADLATGQTTVTSGQLKTSGKRKKRRR